MFSVEDFFLTYKNGTTQNMYTFFVEGITVSLKTLRMTQLLFDRWTMKLS